MISSVTRTVEIYIQWIRDIQNGVSQKKTEIEKLRNLEFEIKSTNNKEVRLTDFLLLANESQNLNSLAKRIANNDLSRFVVEFDINANNSDEVVNIITSFNKSTAKYLETIQLSTSKLNLEMDRLKEIEKQGLRKTPENEYNQSVEFNISKNTQLLERIKLLEMDNLNLKSENDANQHVLRSTSRVRNDSSKINRYESGSPGKMEQKDRIESLRLENNILKREIKNLSEFETENQFLREKMRSSQIKFKDLEFAFEREKNKKKDIFNNDFEVSFSKQNERPGSSSIVDKNTIERLQQEIKRLMESLSRKETTGITREGQNYKMEKLERENSDLRLENQRMRNLENENRRLVKDIDRLRNENDRLKSML